MKARRTGRELFALVLLAAVVRLPWLWLQPTSVEAIRQQLPDQAEYLEIAANLFAGKGLQFIDPRFPDDVVYAFRTPGYPLFLAICGTNPTAVRLAQVAIDCSTVVAIYVLARRWGIGIAPLRIGSGLGWSHDRVPLVAGALVALNPWLIYFSSLLLTETLFTALLAWGMVLLSTRWPGRRLGMIGGLALLGLAVYIRPSALALPAVLGFAAALANRPESSPYHTYRRAILHEAVVVAALGLVMTILLLAPWAIRNRLHPRVGAWIWTTTNAGFTAYDGLRPGATGASDQRFVRDLPELQAMNEVQRSTYLTNLARHEMSRDPLRTLSLAVKKIARTWSPLPLSTEYGRLRYILPGLLYSIPLFILIAIGLWTAPLSRPVKLFLLSPAFYLTLIHALSVGSARYRVPAEAPLAVIAANAFVTARREDRPGHD